MPGAPSKGRPRERQAKFRDRVRVEVVEGSCGYRATGVSIRGNSFYRVTWGTRLAGCRQVATRTSDPRLAYLEVKVQVRDLVRVGIAGPFALMGVGTRGKFVLSSPFGEMGPEDVCRMPQAAAEPGKVQGPDRVWQQYPQFTLNPVHEKNRISNDQELIQSDPTSCPQNQKGNN